jgi:alginate O-acetyltransferase complex protein AlgI
MLFNSIDFAVFLPLVFLIYWSGLHKHLRVRNIFLVAASYLFYGWWDWRFLSLIITSTLVDYLVGMGLQKQENTATRRLLLATSITVNLGLLGFFKYFNFFVDSFASAFTFFGHPLATPSLHIILPVGISFYTFQTLSYSIDVYRRRLEPTRDLAAFAAFVAFFPQLVAGPIERATNLLPQMLSRRTFSYDDASRGIRLMLWGFVKKIVIADSLAPAVNGIFSSYQDQSSGILVLGAVLFGFQIYGDFSGYSDIARGVARLLGFELMVNFNFPYFSRNIAEFWRRWHISLTTWFRDYLYIPLGGSREGMARTIRNVFVIFLVSGLWHGANWTFVVWGLIHALLFVPLYLTGRNRKYLDGLSPGRFLLPRWHDLLKILGVFALVTLAWIFFRSPSIGAAWDYIIRIFRFTSSPGPFLNPYDNQSMVREFIQLVLFVIVEYLLATGILNLYSKRRLASIAVDACLLVLILLSIPVSEQVAFIYFQF